MTQLIRIKKQRSDAPIKELIGRFSTNKKDNATENLDIVVNKDL